MGQAGMKKQFRQAKGIFIAGMCTMFMSVQPNGLHAQAVLTPQQIAQAEALGRKTDIPLKLGTYIRTGKGGDIQAFVTTPEQRVAYAVADLTSYAHGSGGKDPLSSELHLNRLRVSGFPYPNIGPGQRNSRHVSLCSASGPECLKPAHEVLDVNQVVAEFDMPAVIRLSGRSRTFVIRIQTDAGEFEPDITVSLASLNKRR